jgi:hypothetical protein
MNQSPAGALAAALEMGVASSANGTVIQKSFAWPIDVHSNPYLRSDVEATLTSIKLLGKPLLEGYL